MSNSPGAGQVIHNRRRGAAGDNAAPHALATAGAIPPLDVLQRFRPHDFSLRDFLDSRVEANPSKPFLLFEGEEWSYAEFATDVDRCARFLAARKVGAGDRIGVLSPNHPSTAVLLFALAGLGAIMVPANPNYGPDEAAYVFGNSEVAGVLAAPATLAVTETAVSRLAAKPWILLNEGQAGSAHAVLHDELEALGKVSAPSGRSGRQDETCTLIYTSGTTGNPKGVMHRQSGMVLTGEGFVGRMNLQSDERLLCVLPMFHVNALFYSLCGAVACGGSTVLVRRFSASTFWQTAAETKATEVNLMAAAARILMLRPDGEFTPRSTLRKAFIAPLTADLVQSFNARFGVTDIIECYGMSEIPGVIGNPFLGERRVGSMGLITPHPDPAIPRPQARVVDGQYRDVTQGETGELAVKTPTIMQGYFRAPDATAAAFHDGWFLTGDVVWQDQDGYFYFKARHRDIIRRRGENISGAEIDAVMCSHPAVAEAAAIGVASSLGDEDILVAVVRREGRDLSAGEVAAWVAERLAPFKVPRYIAFVPSLPQTATQRIEKYKLRNDASLLIGATDLESAQRPSGSGARQ